MPSTEKSVKSPRRATRSHGNIHKPDIGVGPDSAPKKAAPRVSTSDMDARKPTSASPLTPGKGQTITPRQGKRISTRGSDWDKHAADSLESDSKKPARNLLKRSSAISSEDVVKKAKVEPEMATVHMSNSPRRSSRAVLPSSRFKDMEMIRFGKRKSGKDKVKVEIKVEESNYAAVRVEQQPEPETVIEEVITEQSVIDSAFQMNLMDNLLVLPQSTIATDNSRISGIKNIDLTREGIATEMKSSTIGQHDSTPTAINISPEVQSKHAVMEHHSGDTMVVHVSPKPSPGKASPLIPPTSGPQQNTTVATTEMIVTASVSANNARATAIGSTDSDLANNVSMNRANVTVLTNTVIGGTKANLNKKRSTISSGDQLDSLSNVVVIDPETTKIPTALDTYPTPDSLMDPHTVIEMSASNETVSHTIVVDNNDGSADKDKGKLIDPEQTKSYGNTAGQPVHVPFNRLSTAKTFSSVGDDVTVSTTDSVSSEVVETPPVFGKLQLANENMDLLADNEVRLKDMITKGQVIHVSPSKLQTVSQSLIQKRVTASSHSTQKKQSTLPKSLIIKRPEAKSRNMIPQIIKLPVVRKERNASSSEDKSNTGEYRYEKFTSPPVDTYVTHVRIAPSTSGQGESTVQTYSVDTNIEGSPVGKEQVVTVVEGQQFTDISPIVEPIVSADTDLITTTDSEKQYSAPECQHITEMANVGDDVEQIILPGSDVCVKQIENVTELVDTGSSTELPIETHTTENSFCEVIEYGKQSAAQPENLTAIEYVMFGNNLVPIHKPAPTANIWTQQNAQCTNKPGRVEVASKQTVSRQTKVKPATKEAESLIHQLMEDAKAGTLDIHNAFEVVSLVTKGGAMDVGGARGGQDTLGLNEHGQGQGPHDQLCPSTFTVHGHIERPEQRRGQANVTEISEGTFVKEVYRNDGEPIHPGTGVTVSNQIIVTADPTSYVGPAQSAVEYTPITSTVGASTQLAEITETIEVVPNWPLITQTDSVAAETGSVTNSNETGCTNVVHVMDAVETGKQCEFEVETSPDENIVVISVAEEGSSQHGETTVQSLVHPEPDHANQKTQQVTSQCDNTVTIRRPVFGSNITIVKKPIQKTSSPHQGTVLKSDNIITIEPFQKSIEPIVTSHEESINTASQQFSAGTQTPVMEETSIEMGTGCQTMYDGSDDEEDHGERACGDGNEDSENEEEVDAESGAKIIRVRQKAVMPTINRVPSQEFVMVHLPEGTEIKPPTIKRPVKVDLGIADDQIPMTDDGKYWCVDCPYVTDKKPNWFKHKRKHLGIKPHACLRCPYRASTSSNLKRHIMIHDDIRDFHCAVCGLMFRQKIHLERHIKYRHKEKKVKCPLCEYQCSSENPDLKIHMRRRHMPGEDGTMAHFTCDECGLLTVSRKDLRQHKKFHRKGPELKLFCEYCSFVTDCESRLRRHMLVHTKEKPFQCGLCQYRATQKEHVLRHMRSQHDIEVVRKPRKIADEDKDENGDGTMSGDSESEKERPFDKADYSSTDKIFACNHCSMKFSKLINLYKHLYTQHKNVMPDPAAQDFQCVVCDFRTNNKKNLLVHMRKHNMSDQTPPSHVYSCVLCRYMNPRRRNLFQHMKKKHGIDIVVKSDGSTNCYLSDNTPVILSSENGDGTIVPLTDITTTQPLDEDGNFIQTDNDGQLRIVTDERSTQPGTISIDSIISVEDMSIYGNNNNADIPSISDSQIHTTTAPLYQSPYVEHEAAEAIEGLQALAQQAGILEVQTVDNDITSEVVTSEMLDQEDIMTAEEAACAGNLGDEEIQLSSEQINQLSSGDFVEIDGEVYKVEISTQEQGRL